MEHALLYAREMRLRRFGEINASPGRAPHCGHFARDGTPHAARPYTVTGSDGVAAERGAGGATRSDALQNLSTWPWDLSPACREGKGLTGVRP